jgi:hypothetical protein
MTKKLYAIVEIMGRDPNGLRADCEERCQEWLLGEPPTSDQAELDDLAEYLLRRYLKTIDGRATGADVLTVSVVCK